MSEGGGSWISWGTESRDKRDKQSLLCVCACWQRALPVTLPLLAKIATVRAKNAHTRSQTTLACVCLLCP